MPGSGSRAECTLREVPCDVREADERREAQRSSATKGTAFPRNVFLSEAISDWTQWCAQSGIIFHWTVSPSALIREVTNRPKTPVRVCFNGLNFSNSVWFLCLPFQTHPLQNLKLCETTV